jgi:hypothetical protein
VVADDDALATIFAGHVELGQAADRAVVGVGPRRAVAGRVTDAAGRALAGARVELALPAGFRGRFDDALEHSEGTEWQTETDGDGAFAFGAAPDVADLRVEAALRGYEPSARVLPRGVATDLALVLERALPAQDALVGRVLHGDGRPASGALVAFAGALARPDADGYFHFERELLERARERTVWAFEAGRLPASRAIEGDWPAVLVLTLGQDALRLAGRVERPDESACAGWPVWVADATPVDGAGSPARIPSTRSGTPCTPTTTAASSSRGSCRGPTSSWRWTR